MDEQTGRQAADEQPDKRKWWQRPVTLPLWSLILIGVVLFAAGNAGSGGDSERVASDASGESAPVETVTVTETVTETTVAEPEEEPSPSPEPATMTREQQAATFATFIEEQGPKLADAIEQDHATDGVESADQVVYDADAETLVVAVSTGWGTDPYRRDAAWGITRSLVGVVWSGEVEWLTDFNPSLRLQVDHLVYQCDGELLTDLGARRASRDDWQSSCG